MTKHRSPELVQLSMIAKDNARILKAQGRVEKTLMRCQRLLEKMEEGLEIKWG